jgi:hypothetical protein
MGTAQIGLLSLDRRARTFDSIAPRTDPVMDAIFKKYWAFHNPLWPGFVWRQTAMLAPGERVIPKEIAVFSGRVERVNRVFTYPSLCHPRASELLPGMRSVSVR